MERRKYKTSDVKMLVVAQTIASNLQSNLPAFGADYPKWTADWIRQYLNNIEGLLNRLGVKSNEEQKAATALVRKVMAGVADDLTVVRSQIERGFRDNKTRRGELLELLGFKKSWPKARNNQNAMLELLYTFNNHVGNLRTELTGAGVTAARIDAVCGYAVKLSDANVTQESLKGQSPVMTAELRMRLNTVYDTVIDICSAGKVVFRKDVERRKMFQFSSVAAHQTTPAKNTKPKA